MEYKDTIFICPRCKQEFSLNELINHNEEAFNELINKKVSEKLENEKNNLINDLNVKKNLEISLLKKELESKYNSEKENLNSNFLIKENKFKEDTYNQEILYKTKINDLENKLEHIEETNKNEFSFKEEQLINKFKDELKIKDDSINQEKMNTNNIINELKGQNKLLQENFESQVSLKTKEVENKYLEEMNNKEKLINNQLNELKTQLAEKTNELMINKSQNKLDIVNEVNKTREEFASRIKELELANATNRLIHSKSKGENFEHEVEGELRKAFGYIDKIEKITATIDDKKADYLQTVKNANNKELGKIVYEVKNAKWSDAWLPKLAQDVANNKTKYGILIASSFEDKYNEVPFVRADDYENIYITDPWNFVFIGQVLRRIIEVEYTLEQKEKEWIKGQDNKDLENYKKQVDQIKDFMISDLPGFIKSFNKQLKDIDSVRNSLINNSNKLEKSHNMLQNKFNKEIKEKLQKITDIRIAEENDEEKTQD